MSEVNLKKGIIINFIAKYSNVLVQLMITSILARLLTPKEYGIISVILIFITFFNLLGDMGIGPAIIQYKDLNDKDISNIFLFTLIIAVILGLIFFEFSYFIAYIYDSKVYILIGHLLVINIIFNVLSTVPNALHYKNKQFKIIGISNVISNILAGILTIILAYLGFSYYALVLNAITQSFLNFIILLYFSKIKLKIKEFNFSSLKRIGSFSVFQFLFNFVNYFSRNADNLLIGKFLGMGPLGYYDKAYRLMLYPIQNLTFVINPVLQPVLSDYQNDKKIILMHYEKITKILAVLGAFISVFCFFSSKEIILILFGKQWIGSISSFKLLSISIVIQVVLSSSGAVFQASGNTKQLFKSGLIGSSITVVLIFIGVKFGKIENVALCITLAYLINFLQTYYILIKNVFNRSVKDFFISFKSTVIIIGIMIAAYIIIPFKLSNIMISLLLKFLIGLVFYIIALIITKEYLTLLSLINTKKLKGRKV